MDRSVLAPTPETQRGLFTPETARLAGSIKSARKASAARRNGARGGRPRRVGTAHQYKIREQAARLDPRPPLPNLNGCSVRAVNRAVAKAIILRYEWLGTMGRAAACYGLFSPADEVLGVVCFGWPSSPESRAICGVDYSKLAVCLERGACVHLAPRNAASFLISRAVKLAHLEHGWSIFYAYADPAAGEIGTVYQACGWHYLGQGVGRRPGRQRDNFRRPDGTIVSERALRHGGVKLGDVLGWERITAPPKHKYVHFEGPDAETLRAACRYPFKRYPKRERSLADRSGG